MITWKDGRLSGSLAQLSLGVPVQLPMWMSFLSCSDTQLSQLRLVVISLTISHVSVSSQYLSIVSWYLKQMGKYRSMNSGCLTCYTSVITAMVTLQKMKANIRCRSINQNVRSKKVAQITLSPVPTFFSSQDINLPIHHSSARPVAPFLHGGTHGPLVGFRIVALHFIRVLC